MKIRFFLTAKILLAALTVSGQDILFQHLPEAKPLVWQGDLSDRMVKQIDRFLTEKTHQTKQEREAEWTKITRETGSSLTGFSNKKRAQLQSVWGMSGKREKPVLVSQIDPSSLLPQKLTEGNITVIPVKWVVIDGLEMEGLLIQPKAKITGRMVVIPDADQSPEEIIGLTRSNPASNPLLNLASQGIQIIIPALISRKQNFSGSPALNIYTNQTHREWIYRQGFNVGRHILGYELQKIASCIDFLEQENAVAGKAKLPIALAGYGEGGMLALFSGAVDNRISALLISGYLGNTEGVWQEPIYRNLHGSLKLAGNAELLALCSPTNTIIEFSESPKVDNPATLEGRRGGAAPGRITTATLEEIQKEISLANTYLAQTDKQIKLVSDDGKAFAQPFAPKALHTLLANLGLPENKRVKVEIKVSPHQPNPLTREKALFDQMETLIQNELDLCERQRNVDFWKQIKNNPTEDQPEKKEQRKRFHETIGQITDPLLDPAPRLRLLEKSDKWRKYEVVLDVWEGVFAWGILVVPVSIDLKSQNPVVVCQHGLEGLPEHMTLRDSTNRLTRVYKSMALNLAERGYITFSPHNPYRGEDLFRTLQRKANPIGLSLFSVIVGQHQQIVNWLGGLSFVDKDRIGFYGLSYGGKTAMRIPALVEGYALSICSGDFNEWIRKVASTRLPYSYQFTKEYEIYEWDLGHRFNYAEMAALIAPRPFMVEYGYKDGIGSAEWIGYEFGKVRKHYDLSGLSDRLDIDLFNGVHEINAVKTYPFLDKHLKNKH